MKLWFLGTGAGRPAKHRNVTAVAFQLPEPSSNWWLFDAGEATQHRLMEVPLKLSKLEAVFITHLHGDHLYGLPGLLSTRSFEGGETPLTLYGPAGLKQYIDTVFAISGTTLDYEIIIKEIEEPEEIVFSNDRFTVKAGLLEHRVPCYGYRIIEHDQLGSLLVQRLKELGVAEGPLYGRIKKGHAITLEDGRVIRPEEVIGRPKRGRIVTILGDTSPCLRAVELAEKADVLVHEATFEAGLEEKAHAYGHSTTAEAGEAAQKAGVKQLVLTHFSGRYSNEELSNLVQEAKKRHPDVLAARDFMVIVIDRDEDDSV